MEKNVIYIIFTSQCYVIFLCIFANFDQNKNFPNVEKKIKTKQNKTIYKIK